MSRRSTRGSGCRRVRARNRVRTEESHLELPAYLAGPPIPIVSWLVRRSATAPVLAGLVSDLLIEALRHGEGIVYDVAIGSTPVSGDEGLAVLWADGSEEDQPRILARRSRCCERSPGTGRGTRTSPTRRPSPAPR